MPEQRKRWVRPHSGSKLNLNTQYIMSEEVKKAQEKLYKNIQGITEAMVEKAKKDFGESCVKLMDLPLGENETDGHKTILAAVPSRTVVGQYRRFSDSDPKKADEILVKNCILSHKDEVLADDGLFYGALNGLADLIPVRKAVIKNL